MKIRNSNKGFTLVEIMIVVAIIALLAAVAVPSFLRARKRSQATSIKEELRLIDAAVDQYAIEKNKSSTTTPVSGDIQVYMKSGTRLYTALSGTATSVTDLLGNAITIPAVDSLPQVPSATNSALSDVADASFWAPYTAASGS